jgi:hypothetical protein
LKNRFMMQEIFHRSQLNFPIPMEACIAQDRSRGHRPKVGRESPVFQGLIIGSMRISQRGIHPMGSSFREGAPMI